MVLALAAFIYIPCIYYMYIPAVFFFFSTCGSALFCMLLAPGQHRRASVYMLLEKIYLCDMCAEKNEVVNLCNYDGMEKVNSSRKL